MIRDTKTNQLECDLRPGNVQEDVRRRNRWLSLANTPRRLNGIHVTCDTTSSYVIDFKCALDFGEGQGHDDEEIGDIYSKLKEDVEFRQGWTKRIGLGFKISPERGRTGPNGPKIETEAVAEMVACV